MGNRQTILIIQNESLQLGRSICRGIFRYIRANNLPWRTKRFLQNWQNKSQTPEFQQWKNISGAIISLPSAEKISYLKQPIQFPIVNTFADQVLPPFPQVDTNSYQTGKMAAEYFIRKGFRAFLYLEKPYSKIRGSGFKETLHALGYEAPRLSVQENTPSTVTRVLQTLSSMPKPVALYCEDDQLALFIIQCFQENGFHIPNDIAVLGTQNDDLICESFFPYISSIKLPYEEVGYEAARILDIAMQGGILPRKPIQLDPLGVIERQSTDSLFVTNPTIRTALAYIQKNGCTSIKVSDVAHASGTSLRLLQEIFRTTLGYPIQTEIQRIRVARIRELLKNPTLSLDEITEQVGYTHKSYLGAVFQRVTGMTPGNYRRQFKA